VRLGRLAFRVVRRHELDAWLIQKTRERGVRVTEGTRVTSAKRERDHVLLETSRGPIRCKAVVGADGSKSIVQRELLPSAGGRLARVIEVYTDPSSSRFPTAACADDEAYFEFGCVSEGIEGYVWSFPTHELGEPRRNWGVYDSRVSNGPPAGSLKPLLERELAQHGFEKAARVEGHPIRWYEPGSVISGQRALLVGDAAGVDAAFGEGIGPALGYGPMAAAAIADAVARDDFAFARYSKSVARSALGRSLTLRAHLARVIYRARAPWMQAAVWRHSGPLLPLALRGPVFNWAT
jgi:flavin-dependent dehydrogenase